MNTPRNYITALPSYQFATDQIDDYLPFTGKHVFIRNIARIPKGYGHWKLTVELRINDQKLVLWTVTSDSQLIDEWRTDDREVNQETMAQVVAIVLAANEDKLEDFT